VTPAAAAALTAAAAGNVPPLAPQAPVGLLPPAVLPAGVQVPLLTPFAAALNPHHPSMMLAAAALNGAGLFGAHTHERMGLYRAAGGAGGQAAGVKRRHHQADGSEQADSCLS
jgi:hypothetical protein